MLESGPTTPADMRGLLEPVTLGDVGAYYRRHRIPYSRRWWVIALIVAAYLAGQMALIAVLLPATGVAESISRLVFAGFAIATGAYGTGIMAMIWRTIARQVRLDRAASANGLDYSDREPMARFAGSALQRPGAQFVTDVVRSAEPGFVAATFLTAPGASVRRGGFLQLRLDRQTPHIVLENRRSRVLRATGSRFRGEQRLGLEGDFDRTFTLYCPTGYERDALYIFTPDLMALLLDIAHDSEVELLDGYLVVYVGRPWRLWTPARFEAVLTLAATLGAKARRQTARYRDDRAVAEQNTVAPAGRRLRIRPSAGSVLAMAAPIALVAVGLVVGIDGIL